MDTNRLRFISDYDQCMAMLRRREEKVEQVFEKASVDGFKPSELTEDELSLLVFCTGILLSMVKVGMVDVS